MVLLLLAILLATAQECGQLLGLISGCFDWLDVVSFGVATLVVLACSFAYTKTKNA